MRASHNDYQPHEQRKSGGTQEKLAYFDHLAGMDLERNHHGSPNDGVVAGKTLVNSFEVSCRNRGIVWLKLLAEDEADVISEQIGVKPACGENLQLTR